MSAILSWISVNWIEIAAALVSIAYVILTIKEIIFLWFFGFLSAVLYAIVYLHSGIYAQMALQGYYAFISIYGWYHWSVNSKKTSSGSVLPIVRLKRRLFIILIVAWILLWLLISFVLYRFTDSLVPFWDAFTTSGSIIATWMLTRKILEQWLFWILIDFVAIGLCLWQNLYPTTALFVVYIIMATVGYRQWRKTWQTTV
jgi:nicotinamide mononucleotide transporter